MTAQEARQTIQKTVGALQECLDVLPLLDQRASVTAELATVRAAIESQTAGQAKTLEQQAAAHEKLKAERTKTIEGLDRAIEDRVRQQAVAEANLQQVREAIGREQQAAKATRAQVESDVSALVRKRDAVGGELAALQTKVRAFHADLTGAVAKVAP